MRLSQIDWGSRERQKVGKSNSPRLGDCGNIDEGISGFRNMIHNIFLLYEKGSLLNEILCWAFAGKGIGK